MRIKPVLAIICAAAVGFAAPAAAYEPQSNSVAKEKPRAEKKICRWLPVTGSNMNQKVCLTAEDWKKAEALSW